ncbi:cytochrome c biogenesis protein ResB [Streptomyces sp. NPDC092296]|uniref:cytochrome c biogenesis protein ResB n=1 Tax=Streptomyces sp. NPDC092296 TaxID=3366012 RepID=UPI0038047F19
MSKTDIGARAQQQPLDDEAAAERLSTAPVEETGDGSGPGLGALGWLRWTWRQLTSMRVALILLFLLSLAAVPGSLIPQNGTDAMRVETWKAQHTTVAPIYEKLQLFDVYSSAWFSAIYILLFISLAGCIIPRSWQFVGVLRGRPPAAPKYLARMPVHASWRTDARAEDVTAAAERLLRRRRFRVHASGGAVASEKGYLREVGNLFFHISLFGLLIAMAWGSVGGGQGGKLVLEGQGFSNTMTQYDDFRGSAFYGPDDLAPFRFVLDGFTATYQTTGDQLGTPRDFTAHIHYAAGSESTELRAGTIQVNKPLEVAGSKVYLVGHGYSPIVTVKNAKGEVVFHGPTPFLPQDSNLTSVGAIKVGDYGEKDGQKVQLGFSGIFSPTAPVTASPRTGWNSLFPAATDPKLILNVWAGDLGIDAGAPQNVYQLNQTHLTQLKQDGKIAAVALKPGEGWNLPDGYGTISFDGFQQWASFSISHHPGNGLALGSAVLAVLGLIGSLLIQRRRVWVRATSTADGTVLVEMAGLARSESARIAHELAELAVILQDDAPALPDENGPDENGPDDDGPDDDGPDDDGPDDDGPAEDDRQPGGDRPQDADRPDAAPSDQPEGEKPEMTETEKRG